MRTLTALAIVATVALFWIAVSLFAIAGALSRIADVVSQ